MPKIILEDIPMRALVPWGAAVGTAGGTSAYLPRLRHQGDVVVGRFGTVLGCRWLRMVPLLGTWGAHSTPSGPPGGLTASPRAVCKCWAGLRRDALDSGYGCPCDHAAQAPAVLAVRQRGNASDSVID